MKYYLKWFKKDIAYEGTIASNIYFINDFETLYSLVNSKKRETHFLIVHRESERIELRDSDNELIFIVLNLESAIIDWGNYILSEERLSRINNKAFKDFVSNGDFEKFFNQ